MVWLSVRGGVAACAVGLFLAQGCGSAASAEDVAPRAVNPLASPGPFVRQEQWADRLAAALGLEDAMPPGAPAEQVFALLCPEGVPESGDGAISAVLPRWNGGSGDVPVQIDVPRPGLYVVEVDGKGPQSWRAGGRPAGAINPTPWGVAVAPFVVPLPAGPQTVVGSFESNSSASRVTLRPHRGVCVQPRDGWAAGQPLRFADKARTLVRALGLEGRLPVEGPAEIVEGETFDRTSPDGEVSDQALAAPASGGAWAVAGGAGAELRWSLGADGAGVVTLLARLHGPKPQVWLVGDAAPRTVQPAAGAEGWVWTEIATLPLGAGPVSIRARLAPGSGVDVMRLQRRRDADSDYLAVLDALGVQEGAPDALVDDAAAGANLANPTLRTLLGGFLMGPAGLPANGLAFIEHDQDRLYTRPLSPFVPSEL
jgi:hypothetical protein